MKGSGFRGRVLCRVSGQDFSFHGPRTLSFSFCGSKSVANGNFLQLHKRNRIVSRRTDEYNKLCESINEEYQRQRRRDAERKVHAAVQPEKNRKVALNETAEQRRRPDEDRKVSATQQPLVQDFGSKDPDPKNRSLTKKGPHLVTCC